MSSPLSYGRVDEAAEPEGSKMARCWKRRKVVTIIISCIFLCAIAGVVIGTSISFSGRKSSTGGGIYSGSSPIKAVCGVTHYPDSCYGSLAPMVQAGQVYKPEDLFKISMEVAFNELHNTSTFERFHEFLGSSLKAGAAVDDKGSAEALEICRELLDLAMDNINASLSLSSSLDHVDDIRTWLTAAATFQQTCIDGFEESANGTTLPVLKRKVVELLKNSTEFTSNSLAIITAISKLTGRGSSFMGSRRLTSSSTFPRSVLEISSSSLKSAANVVVAKDGSGNYQTIGEALEAVPDKSETRFVIYVKRGVYHENVTVEKNKWNVWMIGDGMDNTIVSASFNHHDGAKTFRSATFAVTGKGFVGREMGFVNTAGPEKYQAVALRSSADITVFYRCRIDGFQDSLYAHSHRQFYRECDIYGTVDFICGNAAAVFQRCNIFAKKPMAGQKNTITAQSRKEDEHNSGFSIQNCTIMPAPGADLGSVKTFLGRPWRPYSTTVFLGSNMGSLIDPSGWLPWTGDSAPDTIFYAEFENEGPGSSTNKRVKWKGVKNITQEEASQFTVQSLIGTQWISDASVPYNPGL